MPENLEHQIYKEVHQLRQHQKAQRSQKVALMLFITIVIGLLYWTRDQSPAPFSKASTTSTPKPSILPIALPLSGTMTPAVQDDRALGQLRLFLSPPIAADDSTLKNQCPASALLKNDLNYFLKVVDWKSNQTVMTAFVRAGEKVKLNLPLGVYKLRYAAGAQWYGTQHLFGTETRYGEVFDSMSALPLQLKFEREEAGWDLGLYRCKSGGNTTTKKLNPKDF